LTENREENRETEESLLIKKITAYMRSHPEHAQHMLEIINTDYVMSKVIPNEDLDIPKKDTWKEYARNYFKHLHNILFRKEKPSLEEPKLPEPSNLERNIESEGLPAWSIEGEKKATWESLTTIYKSNVLTETEALLIYLKIYNEGPPKLNK